MTALASGGIAWWNSRIHEIVKPNPDKPGPQEPLPPPQRLVKQDVTIGLLDVTGCQPDAARGDDRIWALDATTWQPDVARRDSQRWRQ